MNSFDDLRRRDRENTARELAEKKTRERMMESGQRTYDGLVRKCLRELGEYWFGTNKGLIFSTENHGVVNTTPGEWWLIRKRAYTNYAILVRYIEELGSRGAFSVIKKSNAEEIAHKTRDTSEDELRRILVSIGEKYEKPTITGWSDDSD